MQRYNKKSIYANAKQEKFILRQFLHIFSNEISIKVLQKSYLGLTGFWQEFSAVDVEKLTKFVKNAKIIKISLRMCVKCSTFALDFVK